MDTSAVFLAFADIVRTERCHAVFCINVLRQKWYANDAQKQIYIVMVSRIL